MPIVYRIYANDGKGGDVDYSSPIATTSGLSYGTPLLPSRDYRFAVRAFDPATGLEEANTQAVVRIATDGSGRAIGPAPNPPHALAARPIPNGGCRASWAYSTSGQAATPAVFLVFLTDGSPFDPASPTASIPYQAGRLAYSIDLPARNDGAACRVSVVAQGVDNAAIGAAISTTLTVDSTPPLDVDGLAAAPIY